MPKITAKETSYFKLSAEITQNVLPYFKQQIISLTHHGEVISTVYRLIIHCALRETTDLKECTFRPTL